MADFSRRLAENADGDFFVDSTCIDCETCRTVAPEAFEDGGGFSYVHRQPRDDISGLRAEMALLACPVAAIGTVAKHDLAAARAAFPDPIDGGVYHCGYHAEASYGAASYLIVRENGNILIDSPRFTGPLVARLEALGGVGKMFLTHRDDVADHQKFRDHFGCERIMHAADIGLATRSVETQIEGSDPVSLDDAVRLIPTPGHTRGSVCLLYRDRFLFTGDHLAWSPEHGRVHAFRSVCWYDWKTLVASTRRLADYRFEWILPGHGFRCHFPADLMRLEMQKCLDWMAGT
jgi:glyoxylase-like metal-dependent hydrolase (beta-lactamase superfamily II)